MHFIKYIIIGIANTLIHWSTFFLLLNFFNSLGICNLIAFCTAVTFSFFLIQNSILKYKSISKNISIILSQWALSIFLLVGAVK